MRRPFGRSRRSGGSRRGGSRGTGGLGALELVIGAVAVLIVIIFLLQLVT